MGARGAIWAHIQIFLHRKTQPMMRGDEVHPTFTLLLHKCTYCGHNIIFCIGSYMCHTVHSSLYIPNISAMSFNHGQHIIPFNDRTCPSLVTIMSFRMCMKMSASTRKCIRDKQKWMKTTSMKYQQKIIALKDMFCTKT